MNKAVSGIPLPISVILLFGMALHCDKLLCQTKPPATAFVLNKVKSASCLCDNSQFANCKLKGGFTL